MRGGKRIGNVGRPLGSKDSKLRQRKSIKKKSDSINTDGEILFVDSSIEKCLSKETRKLYKKLKSQKNSLDILKALINDCQVRHNAFLV